MILGFIANIAGYATSKAVLKEATKELVTNTNVVDKVLIPVGSFIISCMVGDACQKYTEQQVEEVKNTVAGVKELGKQIREAKQNDICESESETEKSPEDESYSIFDAEPISEEEAKKDGDSTNA